MTPEDIKKHRKELGLKQAQLSGELCVTIRALRSWENGFRVMPLCVEKLFCLLYNIPFKPPESDRQKYLDEMQMDLFGNEEDISFQPPAVLEVKAQPSPRAE